MSETSKLGDERLAIVFTDLVGFSDWALEAGDDLSLELLREVAEAIEPPVRRHHGEVVKRLGDGMMAVFDDPDEAVAAVFEARERLDAVEVAGYRPRMRAGMHVGTPRRLADDYLGVDVNVAARVADGASGGEFLVSGDALDELDLDGRSARKKLMFRAKGVPSDISAYSLKPAMGQEPEILDEAAIADDEKAVVRRGPVDLMQVPRLLGGALADLRTIAEHMATLPKLLITLDAIQARSTRSTTRSSRCAPRSSRWAATSASSRAASTARAASRGRHPRRPPAAAAEPGPPPRRPAPVRRSRARPPARRSRSPAAAARTTSRRRPRRRPRRRRRRRRARRSPTGRRSGSRSSTSAAATRCCCRAAGRPRRTDRRP